MKKELQLLFLMSGLAYGQTSGPNTPPIGSIVPESISFSIATQSAAELNGQSSLGTLELVDYTQFPDQVLLVAYHASW